MAYIEKDMRILKKKSEDCNAELQAFYKRLGTKLLASTTENEKLSLPINEEAVCDYHRIVDERAKDTENILEIKSSYERLVELSKFKKQIGKSIKDADSSLLKLKGRFALVFYKEFGQLSEFSTLQGYEDIEDTEKNIEDLIEASDAFNEEKKEAGFLAKFNLNRKIASNKLKISLLKRNIEKLIYKKSEEIFNFSAVEDLYNKAQMPEEIEEVYKRTKEEEEKKLDLESRIEDINKEESFLNEKMNDLCGGLSYSKRINSLNDRIKEIDIQVDKILKDVAIEFLNFFIGEDNKVLKDKKESDSAIYDAYSAEIEEAVSLKDEIALLNLNVEYCTLNDKKEAIISKIDGMNRSIENCEEGIKSYQKRIHSLKESIEGSNKEKDKLSKELLELEKRMKAEE